MTNWKEKHKICEASFQLDETRPVKIDLNKKLDPKQKTIQAFNIDA